MVERHLVIGDDVTALVAEVGCCCNENGLNLIKTVCVHTRARADTHTHTATAHYSQYQDNLIKTVYTHTATAHYRVT